MRTKIYYLIIVILFLLSCESLIAQFNMEQVQGPFGGNVDEIAFHPNGNIYVATSNGLYQSNNGDYIWEKVDLGSDIQSVFQIFIHPNGRMIVSGFYYDLFVSDSRVNNWQKIDKEIEDISIDSKGRLYGKSLNGALLVSDDDGDSWEEVSRLNTFIDTYYMFDDNIFFATSSEGVYRSINSGLSWEFTPLEFDITTKFTSDSKSNIYMATWSGLFVSANLGESWEKITLPIEYGTNVSARGILVTKEDKIFLGTNHGVILSEDYCENWTMHSSDFKYVHHIYESPDGELFASDFPKGVLRYDPDSQKWGIISYGINANNITFLKQVNEKLFCQSYTGIYCLHNISGQWDTVQFGKHFEFMDVDDELRIITALGSTINYSIDLGISWEAIQLDEDWGIITSGKILADNTLLVYSGLKRILRSTDWGNRWTEVWSKEDLVRQTKFYSHMNDLYFSRSDALYKSTDKGITWIEEYSFQSGIYTVEFAPWGNMYVGTHDGLYVSSFESKWEFVEISTGTFRAKSLKFAEDGSMFVMDEYIYGSSDRGKTWQPVSENLDHLGVWHLEIFQNNLVLGTGLRGLYKYEINIESQEIPSGISLLQNYPNPFNSTTRIEFYLEEQNFVKINIYNSLGELVKTYPQKYLSDGNYQILWNPGAISSGIYYYQLILGNNSITKKMVYLK